MAEEKEFQDYGTEAPALLIDSRSVAQNGKSADGYPAVRTEPPRNVISLGPVR
jgi:hypothetical protein